MATESNENFVVDSHIAEKQKNKQTLFVDPLSSKSLYLILKNGECVLGTATGFVVERRH